MAAAKPKRQGGKGKPFAKGADARRNPGGRPKEEREVILALREKGDLFVSTLERLIRKGNTKALEIAMNRAYGKPRERVALGGDEDAPPVNIAFVREALAARLAAVVRARRGSSGAGEPERS